LSGGVTVLPIQDLVLLAVAVGQGTESAAIATENISSLIPAEKTGNDSQLARIAARAEMASTSAVSLEADEEDIPIDTLLFRVMALVVSDIGADHLFGESAEVVYLLVIQV
jgi:hypothetical protein